MGYSSLERARQSVSRRCARRISFGGVRWVFLLEGRERQEDLAALSLSREKDAIRGLAAVGTHLIHITAEVTRDGKTVDLHIFHCGEDLVAIVARKTHRGQEVSNRAATRGSRVEAPAPFHRHSRQRRELLRRAGRTPPTPRRVRIGPTCRRCVHQRGSEDRPEPPDSVGARSASGCRRRRTRVSLRAELRTSVGASDLDLLSRAAGIRTRDLLTPSQAR
jgi:hypothetical protein